MKWARRKINNDDGWRWRFALIPICSETHWLWLGWYRYRFCGDCFEVEIP